jgi:hypothetical protein
MNIDLFMEVLFYTYMTMFIAGMGGILFLIFVPPFLHKSK